MIDKYQGDIINMFIYKQIDKDGFCQLRIAEELMHKAELFYTYQEKRERVFISMERNNLLRNREQATNYLLGNEDGINEVLFVDNTKYIENVDRDKEVMKQLKKVYKNIKKK